MQTDNLILAADSPASWAKALSRAVALLRAGELVGLPTETVYGLAADATNPAAVAKIFAVKGRPGNNPIIVHTAGLELARRCVGSWPAAAEALAAAFWPGPLTLVLPRGVLIPDVVAAGGPTVAIRWPSHPFIQAVIRECGFPLAAPSANLAGQLSPTSAQHVRKSLGDRVRLIVDGGQAAVGIESSVLDLTCRPPALLRPGSIHLESLQAVVGEVQLISVGASAGQVPRSPGQLLRHYAPKARLLVWSWRDESDLRGQAAAAGLPLGESQVVAYHCIPAVGDFAGVSVIPHDAEAFGRALYAELHRCDETGARVIILEAPPAAPEWRAIADRLRRAAAAD